MIVHHIELENGVMMTLSLAYENQNFLYNKVISHT